MEREAYYTRAWRDLPRDGECVVAFLFDAVAGECSGAMHRHHVIADDPASRSVQVCAHHHPKLQAALRHLADAPAIRRCPHGPGAHRYPGARESCERRLNSAAA